MAGPPDDVELPEQARVPEVDLPEQAQVPEGETEPFSPTEACGDRPASPVPDRAADKVPPRAPASPTPGAADRSDLPAEAGAGRDRAQGATDEGATRREEAVANAPADRPGGRP